MDREPLGAWVHAPRAVAGEQRCIVVSEGGGRDRREVVRLRLRAQRFPVGLKAAAPVLLPKPAHAEPPRTPRAAVAERAVPRAAVGAARAGCGRQRATRAAGLLPVARRAVTWCLRLRFRGGASLHHGRHIRTRSRSRGLLSRRTRADLSSWSVQELVDRARREKGTRADGDARVEGSLRASALAVAHRGSPACSVRCMRRLGRPAARPRIA